MFGEKRGMKVLSPTEAAYIAGILDGEGCVSLRKETRKANRRGWRLNPITAIFGTNLEMLEWVQEACGAGALWRVTPSKKHHKPQHKPIYQLQFRQGICRDLLPQLLPYLIIKRQQAILLLEYLGMVSQGSRMSELEEVRALQILHEIQVRRVRVTT